MRTTILLDDELLAMAADYTGLREILADTSIWVDHLHGSDPLLAARLSRSQVTAHRFMIGELAAAQQLGIAAPAG